MTHRAARVTPADSGAIVPGAARVYDHFECGSRRTPTGQPSATRQWKPWGASTGTT